MRVLVALLLPWVRRVQVGEALREVRRHLGHLVAEGAQRARGEYQAVRVRCRREKEEEGGIRREQATFLYCNANC